MVQRSGRSREQWRMMIMSAARDVVEREGYAGLTMRKVARLIDCSVGKLYLAFRNQDELIVALNAVTVDEIHAALDAAACRHSAPRERLHAMSAAYIDFARAHGHRWQMVFEHRLPAGQLVLPVLERRVAQMFDLVTDTLRPLMPRAGEDQVLAAATAVWSGVHGVCTLALTGKLVWGGIESADYLCEILLEGYLRGLEDIARV